MARYLFILILFLLVVFKYSMGHPLSNPQDTNLLKWTIGVKYSLTKTGVAKRDYLYTSPYLDRFKAQSITGNFLCIEIQRVFSKKCSFVVGLKSEKMGFLLSRPEILITNPNLPNTTGHIPEYNEILNFSYTDISLQIKYYLERLRRFSVKPGIGINLANNKYNALFEIGYNYSVRRFIIEVAAVGRYNLNSEAIPYWVTNCNLYSAGLSMGLLYNFGEKFNVESKTK